MVYIKINYNFSNIDNVKDLYILDDDGTISHFDKNIVTFYISKNSFPITFCLVLSYEKIYRNYLLFSHDYCGDEDYTFYYNEKENKLETSNESVIECEKHGFMNFCKYEFMTKLNSIEETKNYLSSVDLNKLDDGVRAFSEIITILHRKEYKNVCNINEIIKFVIKNGGDLNLSDDHNDCGDTTYDLTPFEWLCLTSNDLDLLTYCLKKRARILSQNFFKKRPFGFTVSNDVIELLKKHNQYID